MSRLRRWWPVLFLALVPVIPLWRAVFLGEAIGPFDQIRQMAPWNGPAPAQAWDVLQADGVLQFYGWRDLVFESWRRRELPLWNPYELCGTPLLADSQSGALYPPHIVMGVLHVPTAAAMTLLAWLHLFWAGLGVFLLSGRLGATRVGGVVAGAGFALSAFMLSWLALPSVISTVAWIPWVLLGTYGVWGLGSGAWEARPAVADGEGGGGVRVWGIGSRVWGARPAVALGPTGAIARLPNYRIAGRIVGLAFPVAMMLLAGHLQFAAYGLAGAGLVALCLSAEALMLRKRNRIQEAGPLGNRGATPAGPGAFGGRASQAPDPRPQTPSPVSLVLFVLGITLGAMLAAPQLLPVLNYGKFSHRVGKPTETGYKNFAGGALRPFEFTGLVYPGLLGNPTEYVPNLDVKPGLSAYWPQYAKQGSNFAETAVSLGPIVVLMLCFLRRRRWRNALPLAAVGVAGLLVAVDSPLAKLLYFAVPGWSASGSTGRAGVLFLLAACTIAALAVRDDDEAPPSAKAYAPLLAFGVLTALSILALQACGSVVTPLRSQMAEAWSSIVALATGPGAKLAVLAAAICLGAGYALVRSPRWGRRILIAAACAVPLLLCGSLVRTGSSDFLESGSPSEVRYAFIDDSWEIAFAAHALMPPNTAGAKRMHDVAGYDSLLHRDTVAMLRDIDLDDKGPAPAANGNMMFVKSSADPGKLADAGVTVVWSLKPLMQFGRPTAEQNGVLEYRLKGPGRASTPSGPAEIVEEGFDHMLIDADGPGKLIVRDRNMPGWTAEIDGRPASIGGSLWREIELPAGRHAVSFRYRPPGLVEGSVFAIAALAILVGIGIAGAAGLPASDAKVAQTR